jgi:hypothetical protein
MIRSTRNEGISSASKQRHEALGLINDGVGGESIENVAVLLTGAQVGPVVEKADALDDHIVTNSVFPSNAFAGTFE